MGAAGHQLWESFPTRFGLKRGARNNHFVPNSINVFPRKLTGQLRKQFITIFVSSDAGSGGRQVFLEC